MSDPHAWGPLTRVHTFSTGREAVIRKTLPTHALVDRAIAAGIDDIFESLEQVGNGALTDKRKGWLISKLLVQLMFVDPVVAIGPDDDGMPLEALEDAELEEVLTLAMEEVARAATFRQEQDGAPGRADGARVADEPKRPRRVAAGKR